MNKFYVVTKGRYSDYHIIAVTADKKVAKKIADKFNRNYNETCIEEYCDAEIYLKPLWSVRFDKNGKVERVLDHSDEEYIYETVDTIRESFIGGGVEAVVTAENADAAIKIAAEKRAEYLAQKHGIV